MAERCFLMPVMTATEALQVLASLVGSAEAARAARLRVRPEAGGYARILIPDPYVKTGTEARRKQREALFQALTESVRKVLGGGDADEEAHLDPDGRGIMDAFEAAPWLLLVSGWRRGGDAAEPIPGEALVLLRSGDEDAAWAVFDQLNVHATAVRVAAAEPVGGSGGRRLYLFHLRDDEARISSFQGLRSSGLLEPDAVLDGFSADGRSLFLPGGTAPDAQALRPFLKICTVLTDLAARNERGPVLALTAATEGAEHRVDLYPLNRLSYRDKTALWPVAGGDSETGPMNVLRVHDLANSDRMVDALAERIRAAEPLVGYELELRTDYPGPGTEIDLLRVQERIAYYSELAAYLGGLTHPQPLLMRFADRDLPALADALRRFTLKDIDDGRVRYAFQATGADDGVHYLLVAPEETAPSSPLPEEFWQDRLGAQPMLFRVDPFFARFYDSARPRSLVFVPERAALFPPLHSWDQADIDGYLRSTLSGWFHGRHGAQAIPAEPFYLFRHDGQGMVVVEILDSAAFVPIRQRIGWLNRNLELRHRLEVESLVVELADKAGRAALADRVVVDEKVAVGAFNAAAQRAERHVGGQLEELLDLLAEEAGEAASRALAASETLERLYEDLDVIDAAVAELTKRTRSVETALDGLNRERKGFVEKREQYQKDVVDVIASADTTLASLEESVTRRIGHLKDTYRRLRAMLDDGRSGL